MLAFEQECRERSKNELEQQMAYFRSVELGQMRLEEAQRNREQVQAERARLQKEYMVG